VPATSEHSFDILPSPELIGALTKLAAPDQERQQLIADLREIVNQGHAALEQLRAHFDEHLANIARSDVDPERLASLVQGAGEKRGAAAEKVYPVIEGLQRKIVKHSDLPEALRCLEEGVEIAKSALGFYDSFHRKLLNLAAERRQNARKVLRARPVAGEIDYAELSREHIARYPKIRAALAE
jgi:hypothetical protein